ncbi:MAG: DUF1036 domain-containing protein [Oligoflexales bacterium]|nr:DUF1036 domain-containing protein [Oligoflexales bacterium]
MKTSLRSVFALFFILMAASPAQAGCRWVWNGIKSVWECDSGRTYNSFNVKNSCNRNVRVGVHYYVAENGSGTWRDAGWYNFVPGENAYLVPSTSRNIYVYAESMDGTLTWGGDQCNIRLYGKTKCGKLINMGEHFTNYTYNLTCK